MLIKLTEEQRKNIMGLIARTPKLPNENSFEFAQVINEIGQALNTPVDQTPPVQVVDDGVQ